MSEIAKLVEQWRALVAAVDHPAKWYTAEELRERRAVPEPDGAFMAALSPQAVTDFLDRLEAALEAQGKGKPVAAWVDKAHLEDIARGMNAKGVTLLRPDMEPMKHHRALYLHPAPADRDAVIEECAQVAEKMPGSILAMWERPGGPPGNGYRAPTADDYAAACRALPLPNSGEGK